MCLTLIEQLSIVNVKHKLNRLNPINHIAMNETPMVYNPLSLWDFDDLRAIFFLLSSSRLRNNLLC